eukprot:7346379-Prymnesium_polylepis.2
MSESASRASPNAAASLAQICIIASEAVTSYTSSAAMGSTDDQERLCTPHSDTAPATSCTTDASSTLIGGVGDAGVANVGVSIGSALSSTAKSGGASTARSSCSCLILMMCSAWLGCVAFVNVPRT